MSGTRGSRYDDLMTITAAVDGSALGNPGPSGWAWIVSDQCWDAGGWAHGTNNLGELTAVLELLRATREAGRADEPLKILADSQYAINVVTKWRHGWRKRGWQKADKKPIANLDVIQALDEEMAGRDVTFEWVRGHAGHELNEKADDRARGAAEACQAGRVPEPGPRFGYADSGSRSTDEGEDASAGEASVDRPASVLRDGGRGVSEAGAPEPRAPGEADDQTRVVSAEKDFVRAWAAGDHEALMALSAPGARRVWADGSMRSGLGGPAPVAPRIGRIDVTSVGPEVWLVTYRMSWRGGTSIEASVWSEAVLGSAAGLILVWHQSTLSS